MTIMVKKSIWPSSTPDHTELVQQAISIYRALTNEYSEQLKNHMISYIEKLTKEELIYVINQAQKQYHCHQSYYNNKNPKKKSNSTNE
jgi:hypothetical protein